LQIVPTILIFGVLLQVTQLEYHQDVWCQKTGILMLFSLHSIVRHCQPYRMNVI